PVLEHVAEVGVATAADHLHAAPEPAVVLDQTDAILLDRLPETRPPRAGVVLGLGVEQRLAAADTLENAVVLGVPVSAAEGPLGALLPRHPKLLVRQLRLPRGLTLLNSSVHRHTLPFAHGGLGLPVADSQTPKDQNHPNQAPKDQNNSKQDQHALAAPRH